MAGIIRTSAAEVDLADIWSHIADDNVDAADRLLGRIDTAFDLIAKSPEIGFTIEGIRAGVRCKPVKRNFLIFYEVIDDSVYILRVLHGARKFEDLL
jgi:toxin ParE1/3/4